MLGGIEALARHGYEITSWYCSSPVTILRTRRRGQTVLWLDSLNWFAGRLADWGEAVGLPKLEVDTQSPDDELISRYCRRDVEILVRLWDEWHRLIDAHDLGGPAVTVGGQAMRAYRYRYMTEPIYVHDRREVLDLERRAYYGGRCECWYVGRLPPGRWRLLDVSSMYPYVMSRYEYPRRLVLYRRDVPVEYLTEALRQGAVIADVEVEITRPVLPYRQRWRTVYPIGRWRGVYAGPELELVLRHGRIVRVHALALYETADLFSRYMSDMYRLKQMYEREGMILWRQLVKLLANSLYGKWGQTSRRWVRRPNDEGWEVGVYDLLDAQDGRTYTIVCLGEWLYSHTETVESAHSCPVIAATITSWARRTLWDLIEEAGYDHVYYMDTDSLLVDEVGYERLAARVDGERLGGLKVEVETDGGALWGPKDYELGPRRRIKGISASAEEVAPGVWRDLEWPGLWGLLRAGRIKGYRCIPKIKRLRRRYTKGRVRPDGRVEPLVVWAADADADDLPY